MALADITVLELAGLAPAPFCGMILADFGANVIRVDRAEGHSQDFLVRGKRSIALNLKTTRGVETLMKLIGKADVVIEPFRPGVAERLGFGPEVALSLNPRLIYARLTGFGQSGPYATMAGHDINYIALSGALSLFGPKADKPAFPSNLLGDFAGGGLTCALGILLALFERSKSGKGQVVDASMVAGTNYLNTFLFRLHQGGTLGPRGTNLLDGGSPFYDTYKTKDGQFVAVGPLEPHFFALLLKGLNISPTEVDQNDHSRWPQLRAKFTEVFASKTRDEWSAIFDGTDACVVPVLGIDELTKHSHTKNLELVYTDNEGTKMTSPAPLLSRTPAQKSAGTYLQPGKHTVEVLKENGFTADNIQQLLANGDVKSADIKASL
eukprot:TRINITY_DN4581_c0_g1_i3.p1 TRINITY_DN4581_c0_g1~~TRINITY_DN4581_c0_g1_i3.p1  ORF type:complete len:380 (+),score=23.53 TRINITY_DN4581_c0_g1_i3:16-1155(+)